jgi:pyruvate dehydrogenase E1 component
VLIAYTVKGNGLATAGHPQNHSALLKAPQIAALAEQLGESLDNPWRRFDPTSAAGQLCTTTAHRLQRFEPSPSTPPAIPADLGRTPTGTSTTQAALGRTLLDLTRAAPEVGKRIVTVSPDVSSSTNLSGWVNKVGVWAPTEHTDWFADDPETILHWRERPSGQHLELGIAETNLVGLIGELGSTRSRWGQPLLPIGVLYDPFVTRALEPWSFGIYAGGQSILIGTPQESPSPPKAARTNPSSPPPSASSSPAAPAGNRLSPSTPNGACSPPSPSSADQTAARPICDCPPDPSTRAWPPCPTTQPPENAAAASSSQAATICAKP